MGFAGLTYGAVATVLGLVFIKGAVDVYRRREGAAARAAAGKLFGFRSLSLRPVRCPVGRAGSLLMDGSVTDG